MVINIMTLDDKAVVPKYAKDGDAGLDLTATSFKQDEYGNVVYGTGLAMEIPEGYVGLIFPRSSNSKKDLYLTNHVGVVDSGYRGEIMFKFRPTPQLTASSKTHDYGKAGIYGVGERVGQMVIMPYPQIEFNPVLVLSDSDRGTGGYGSSGK
jgi:dUTP pyrophosphatase